MFSTLQNAWRIPELRKKLIFTMLMLLIYRLGNVIPVPFIDAGVLASYFDNTLSNTILGLYDAMSGSAFSQASVLALGIQPYINASIILQLLTVAIPYLERLSKEGEEGRKKIQNIIFMIHISTSHQLIYTSIPTDTHMVKRTAIHNIIHWNAFITVEFFN